MSGTSSKYFAKTKRNKKGMSEAKVPKFLIWGNG